MHDNHAEFVSWENSLKQMQGVLDDASFSDDIQIAVEYQIPQTSKRVDFVIAGSDEAGNDHVVIVELKQWEEAGRTATDGIVTAFTGGVVKAVAHPSYQAYSYAKTIENFNATVQDEQIGVHPCAYLHNYKPSKREELEAPIYQEILLLAPLYIKSEENKLRKFIKQFVIKASQEDLLNKIDNGRIRPSKALQDTIASMLAGNQEFIMLDEQKVVYEAVKNLVRRSLEDGQKYTVIIEGGPGTGKSVVAVQLLVDLILNQNLLVNYVTKNAAPRNVYFEKLKQGKALNDYVKTLFKSSGTYYDCAPDTFDCLIVDESHRLNARSGMFKNAENNTSSLHSSAATAATDISRLLTTFWGFAVPLTQTVLMWNMSSRRSMTPLKCVKPCGIKTGSTTKPGCLPVTAMSGGQRTPAPWTYMISNWPAASRPSGTLILLPRGN